MFQVGDTVALNSGGHLMTVVSVDENSITCDWSVRGDVKSKSFPATALKRAVSEQTAQEAQRAVILEDLGAKLRAYQSEPRENAE